MPKVPAADPKVRFVSKRPFKRFPTKNVAMCSSKVFPHIAVWCQYIFDWLVNLLLIGLAANKEIFQNNSGEFPVLYGSHAFVLS